MLAGVHVVYLLFIASSWKFWLFSVLIICHLFVVCSRFCCLSVSASPFGIPEWLIVWFGAGGAGVVYARLYIRYYLVLLRLSSCSLMFPGLATG